MRTNLLSFDPRESQRILANYHKLPPIYQEIAQLLTVTVQDHAQYDLVYLIAAINIKMSLPLSHVLDTLTQQEVISCRTQFYRINPNISEQLMENCCKNPTFVQFAQSLLKRIRSMNADTMKFLNFRIALYSGDRAGMVEHGDGVFGGYSANAIWPAVRLFMTPYSKERFNRLAKPELKKAACRDLISYFIMNGLSDQNTILTEQYAQLLKQDDNTTFALEVKLHLFMNRMPIASKERDPFTDMLPAVLAGEWETADRIFTQFNTMYSYAQNEICGGISILFEILTLLNTQNSKRLKAILPFLREGAPSVHTWGVFGTLAELIEIRLGMKQVQQVNTFALEPRTTPSVYSGFVRLLASYWLDMPDHEERMDSFLENLGEEPLAPFWQEQFELLKTGEGIASLLTQTERWMGTVESLLALFRNDDESTVKTERLVWRIRRQNGSIRFTPTIQKRGKNGQWSKGRETNSPYELERKLDEMETLSCDTEMLENWRLLEENSWNGRGGKFEKSLIKLAINHPRLYDKEKQTPISLVEEPFTIKTTKKNGQIQLTVSPSIPESNGMAISRKGEIISVAFATEQQAAAAKLIADGLKIPVAHTEKASQLFTALGETFTVEGDTAVLGKDLPTFDGLPEPQFFIEPFETGIQFRLRVVPSDSATAFVPARGKKEFIGLDSTTSVLVKRNFEAEKVKTEEILDSIPTLLEQFSDDYHWTFPDPIEALDVLEQIKNHPVKPVLNWPKGESLIIRKSVAAESVFRSVERKKEWFELGGSIEIDKNLVLSLKTLIGLARESESRFVRMQNGEYLALTKTLKQELDTLADLVAPSKGETIKLHPLAMIAMADSYIGEEFEDSRQWIAQFRENHEKTFALPRGLKVELRDYQNDGYQWLMRLAQSQAGALLADDMGLGKTVQAIALLASRKKEGPALVIAPASLGFNWADEIRRFAPNLNPQILGMENRESQIKKLSAGDILITTYGLVQRNPELFSKKSWQTMILDEAQAVKNNSAKRTQIIKEIPRDFTLITTGTPVENHLGELWNLFDIILPGFLGSAAHFRESFQLPIEKYENKNARKRFKRLISPFILRRTKEEVLTELPPKTEINLVVELGAKEMAFYEALRQEAIDKLANPTKDEDQRFQVLAEITKLRQACLHPKLIDKTSSLESAKIELLTEKVEELIEGNHQALVFSQFTGFLKMIAKALDHKKIPYFYLDGLTPAKDRGDLVNQFQNGDRPIFLISLKAGGSGLNLTNADYVFHMDPWWNPAVEDQASDRAHRIGQERPVTVYRLIAAGSIEEKIIGLHQEKRGLAEALLSDSATSLKLDTKELIDIISKR